MPAQNDSGVKVVIVIQRGGALLCREARKARVPEVGQALTLLDEGEDAEHAGQVELVVPGPKGVPYVYGGAWGQEVEDSELRRLGFRACAKGAIEVLEQAVG
jgi:hypothetical protein